ncbi:RICIN domain-containing protein [Actinomadura sp. 1N219]|uniref:RICIN domain-containing protein n=1 Tax=Actinomadura sp. 1N219 TaxID=3375152 RepID=UPI00379A77EC
MRTSTRRATRLGSVAAGGLLLAGLTAGTGGTGAASAVTTGLASAPGPQPGAVLAGVQIKPRTAAGQCLDVADANDGNGAMVTLWTCNGSQAQRWSLVDGRIQSDLPSHRCLDVRAGNRGQGTLVGMYQCNSSPQQQWHFDRDRLISGLNRMCMSLLNNFSDGAAVVNWPCNGNTDQSWETS